MEIINEIFQLLGVVFFAFGILFCLGFTIMVLGALQYEFKKWLDNLPDNLKNKDNDI